MRRMLFGLTAILLAAALVGPAPVRAGETAMVVDLGGGRARFESGENIGRDVSLMDFLSEGDRIGLSEGTVLVINYFESGAREKITGPGALVVGVDKSEAGNMAVESSQAAFDVAAVVADADETGMGAVPIRDIKLPDSADDALAEIDREEAARRNGYSPGERSARFQAQCLGPGMVTPLNLFMTMTHEVQPVFRWKPVEGAASYKLALMGQDEKKVFDTSVKEPQAAYEGSALEYGRRYFWTVTALAKDGGELATGGGEFRLPDLDVLAAFQKEDRQLQERFHAASKEAMVGLVVLYQKYGLYDRAVEVASALLAESPDSPGLQKRMAQLDPSLAPVQP